MNKSSSQVLQLTRDCNAILIPAGTPVLLPENTEVVITQDLGGHVTVRVFDNLARIDSNDTDALGPEYTAAKPSANKSYSLDGPLTDSFILEVLKSCYDPEIPINIVDLGLIYSVTINPIDQTNNHVDVQMTLTAAGCGIGPVLVTEVEAKVRAIESVNSVAVELVFDPPWHQGLMSEEAKLTLNLF